jgi:hypothetical protein
MDSKVLVVLAVVTVQEAMLSGLPQQVHMVAALVQGLVVVDEALFASSGVKVEHFPQPT